MDVNNFPLPVKRALKQLGRNLCDARKRRRIPMELAAARAGISRTTLSKIEKGDEGVSIGAYARILFVLGMIGRISELAEPARDALGLELEAESLPKRVRIPKQERGGINGTGYFSVRRS